MKNLSAVLFFYLLLTSCFSQWPPSFNYGNQSFAYEELITAYQELAETYDEAQLLTCLLYTSPSTRDRQKSRMPSSA